MRTSLVTVAGGIYMAVQTASSQKTIRINSGYLRAKRVFDIAFTLLLLIPIGIIIAIVAVLIRLDSKGPVFFRQRRVGLNGVEFDLFKFRSMYVNSDDSPHREAIKQYMNGATLNSEQDTAIPYKLENDPRVTRVGRFIRKTSLDELPQFWNVLRGEMTLVGPRPPLAYEVELYSPRDWLRLCGKPGLTGNWQVYGRSQVPFQTMVDMDIAYLQQQSFWRDLKLIALTVPVMLKGRGGV
jgi:lipopolysaccharide/colanic/teichoic acid biosynthesis glycosyltransferase